MNVVDMESVSKKQKEAEKDHLLNTLNEIKQKIEDDEISAFVFCALRTDEDVEITACVKDRLDAIGLIETSKMILFTNGQQAD